MAVGDQVARGHDEVELLLVLTLVGGDGSAVVITDDEAQVGAFARRDALRLQVEGVAALGDLESAGRLGLMPAVCAASLRVR